MKSQLEQHGAVEKKHGTGGGDKTPGGFISFLWFILILAVLPLGTAFFFSLGDLVGGSWKEGLTRFVGVLIIGFLFEAITYAIFRFKNKEK